jgi:hypothetical protein
MSLALIHAIALARSHQQARSKWFPFKNWTTFAQFLLMIEHRMSRSMNDGLRRILRHEEFDPKHWARHTYVPSLIRRLMQHVRPHISVPCHLFVHRTIRNYQKNFPRPGLFGVPMQNADGEPTKIYAGWLADRFRGILSKPGVYEQMQWYPVFPEDGKSRGIMSSRFAFEHPMFCDHAIFPEGHHVFPNVRVIFVAAFTDVLSLCILFFIFSTPCL